MRARHSGTLLHLTPPPPASSSVSLPHIPSAIHVTHWQSIIRKRIKFKFTSATASDFTDEALEKFKSEDDSQCTGLLVKAQAGRSYDNPRIGICVDLTGHSYNAKIQGPIGRGMRVWRARIEDGASQVCASIAEKFRLLDNPNICEQQPDQTYTYQQKL